MEVTLNFVSESLCYLEEMLPIMNLFLSLHYREKLECMLRPYIIVIGRMIPLKDVYDLILGICENVILHGKRELQMSLRLQTL